MTKPVVLSETSISMADLKEYLEAVKKRDSELNFRAGRTEEYLSHFVTLSKDKAAELFKKLEELQIPRMKPEHIYKLVDILPMSADEVKLVLQGYTITVTKENLSKIAETIAGAVGKKAAEKPAEE
jgi:DNA-directed RNA polymerase subunit F